MSRHCFCHPLSAAALCMSSVVSAVLISPPLAAPRSALLEGASGESTVLTCVGGGYVTDCVMQTVCEVMWTVQHREWVRQRQGLAQ